MKNLTLPRLDQLSEVKNRLLRYCRLKPGDVWRDPLGRHRVGCLDAANSKHVKALMGGEAATLSVQDPPYNQVAFEQRDLNDFVEWCGRWVSVAADALTQDSSLYVWLGADQNHGFQPLPDFMLMMRDTPFRSRSFITMRNQRGYRTQKNWMAVRQELLYYTLGNPPFDVEAEYTDIPKILRGYYKVVNGARTENIARSGSDNIRAGNVWVDVQQVFYRLKENVNGCYAQKPLKCIDRIIRASSREGDAVVDFFSHSGTTLLSSERLNRRCFTMDIDPVFSEITIRRLERFRETGLTGWQNSNSFEAEIDQDATLRDLLGSETAKVETLPLLSSAQG